MIYRLGNNNFPIRLNISFLFNEKICGSLFPCIECINTAKHGLSVDPSWVMLKERLIEADGVMKGKLTESQIGAGFFLQDGRVLS